MGETINLVAVCLTIIIIVSIITGGIVYGYKIRYDNFQVTIKDLNNDQKCLHICGFEFDSYYESYKFCTEKCDRISERNRVLAED